MVLTTLLSFHCFRKAGCGPFFLYSEKDGQLRRQRDDGSGVEKEALGKSKLKHMSAMFDRQSSRFSRRSFIPLPPTTLTSSFVSFFSFILRNYVNGE